MRRRSAVAGAVAACAVAVGAWWGWTPQVAPMSADAAPARSLPPVVECTLSRGVWRCVVPTPGRPAYVTIRVFEDGSGRCVVADPDAWRWTGGRRSGR